MNSKLQGIELGQRYREARSGFLGRSTQIWVVRKIFTGTDGFEYAHLVCEGDPSLMKPIATAVLADRRRFLRVGE